MVQGIPYLSLGWLLHCCTIPRTQYLLYRFGWWYVFTMHINEY